MEHEKENKSKDIIPCDLIAEMLVKANKKDYAI